MLYLNRLWLAGAALAALNRSTPFAHGPITAHAAAGRHDAPATRANGSNNNRENGHEKARESARESARENGRENGRDESRTNARESGRERERERERERDREHEGGGRRIQEKSAPRSVRDVRNRHVSPLPNPTIPAAPHLIPDAVPAKEAAGTIAPATSTNDAGNNAQRRGLAGVAGRAADLGNFDFSSQNTAAAANRIGLYENADQMNQINPMKDLAHSSLGFDTGSYYFVVPAGGPITGPASTAVAGPAASPSNPSKPIKFSSGSGSGLPANLRRRSKEPLDHFVVSINEAPVAAPMPKSRDPRTAIGGTSGEERGIGVEREGERENDRETERVNTLFLPKERTVQIYQPHFMTSLAALTRQDSTSMSGSESDTNTLKHTPTHTTTQQEPNSQSQSQSSIAPDTGATAPTAAAPTVNIGFVPGWTLNPKVQAMVARSERAAGRRARASYIANGGPVPGTEASTDLRPGSDVRASAELPRVQETLTLTDPGEGRAGGRHAGDRRFAYGPGNSYRLQFVNETRPLPEGPLRRGRDRDRGGEDRGESSWDSETTKAGEERSVTIYDRPVILERGPLLIFQGISSHTAVPPASKSSAPDVAPTEGADAASSQGKAPPTSTETERSATPREMKEEEEKKAGNEDGRGDRKQDSGITETGTDHTQKERDRDTDTDRSAVAFVPYAIISRDGRVAVLEASEAATPIPVSPQTRQAPRG